MEFKNLIESYIGDYVREYGERSARKTIETIISSKFTELFLRRSIATGVIPTHKAIETCVLNNFSFTFANRRKVRFASIMLLNIWNNEVNKELYLASDSQTGEIFQIIISYNQ